MERVTELLFGYGRWMCPGTQIALLELSKVIFEVNPSPRYHATELIMDKLFRAFDFHIIDPKRPWSERQFSIFLIKDMWMRVTERREGSCDAS